MVFNNGDTVYAVELGTEYFRLYDKNPCTVDGYATPDYTVTGSDLQQETFNAQYVFESIEDAEQFCTYDKWIKKGIMP